MRGRQRRCEGAGLTAARLRVARARRSAGDTARGTPPACRCIEFRATRLPMGCPSPASTRPGSVRSSKRRRASQPRRRAARRAARAPPSAARPACAPRAPASGSCSSSGGRPTPGSKPASPSSTSAASGRTFLCASNPNRPSALAARRPGPCTAAHPRAQSLRVYVESARSDRSSTSWPPRRRRARRSRR
jgi:hypothetical protein